MDGRRAWPTPAQAVADHSLPGQAEGAHFFEVETIFGEGFIAGVEIYTVSSLRIVGQAPDAPL